MMTLYNVIEQNIIIKDRKKLNAYKAPIEYFLATGLTGKGTWNKPIAQTATKEGKYSEKRIELRNIINNTLSNYNANTFIKHLNDKLKFTWTDGTYYVPNQINRKPVKRTILHEFVLQSGKYVKYYKYIPQIMHMSMLILIFIGICKVIKNKDFKNINVIFYFLMFGFILFFLIWEDRSRYILAGLPFFIIAQIEGLEIICRKRN